MSQHKLPGILPRHQIVLGWDEPFDTYFAQVWDRHAESSETGDGCLVLWVGKSWGEIGTVEDLSRLLADYVTIPPGLLQQLDDDRTRASRKPFS